jgi:hypothetical protein
MPVNSGSSLPLCSLFFPLSTLSRLLLSGIITITAAFAQLSPGSIQGTVVGDDGKPITGARVYAAIKSSSQRLKAPPTIATKAGDAVNAAPEGSFTISNLQPGPYILCAQTVVSSWLDPCQWATIVPLVTLSSGQKLTTQKVVMAKGAVIQIRINDPSKLLDANGAIAQDVEVLALASNKAYYHARVASKDANGRNHELTVPCDAVHTVIVRSQKFILVDSKGASAQANGHTQPVQAANGKATPPIIFTVTGKSK